MSNAYVNFALYYLYFNHMHYIRVISLFYIDFGNISQFPYFSGINPALAENPIFYILIFQGPKRRPNDLIFYGRQFLEGTKRRSEGSEKRRPEGRKRWAHAARFLGRVGPPILGLEPPMPSIFVPVPSF